MQPGALRALEFDRIVEAVQALAVTPMAARELGELTPATELRQVAELLAETTETVRFLAAGAGFPLAASEELPQILSALAVEGRPLEPLRLLALCRFLESVEHTRGAIRRTPGSFPRLLATSDRAASFKAEGAEVASKIDPAGDVVDHASPALKLVRDRLRKQRARLRTTLESYLRGRDTAKHLQEQVVTERNGRYVLVVKSEHRSAIPGIVHGSSASGASLFLEPLSTVEINNDIVALEQQEQEEVRRILEALTDAFRRRAADLHRTIDAATALDVLQARARFSNAVDGVEPALSTDGTLELLEARHPLLVPRVGAPADARPPVPVTIRIVRPDTVLLVTGPNTGGKTVALKTAGLLALMAQCGLRIPAADASRLPVFRAVFADIGDEQSIDASLSTFSAHITNMVSMDRLLATPALVLLDEIGSGTDPVEGGALGVAIVDHFKRRGAMVIATSHYDALKTYASTTAGVASAAFGFEPDTFAPTYRLVYGSPGRSLALEIAARLGLSSEIVDDARGRVGAREAQLAEHLAKIDRDMRALDHEQRLAARERETLSEAEARLRQRETALREREEASRRRLGEQLDGQVREARREIDKVITDLKARAAAIAAAPRLVSTGDMGQARSHARTAVDEAARRILAGEATARQPGDVAAHAGAPAVAGAARHATAGSGLPSTAIRVGDRVVVGMLGLQGTVTEVHGASAEVNVNGKRMRVESGALRLIESAAPAAPRVRVNVELQPRDQTVSDLNVIGCTVDEALARTERFLDESLLTDQHTIRVIHGYGTGQLKRALAGFFQQHPLVAKFQTAPPDQGGGGVTVVELKD